MFLAQAQVKQSAPDTRPAGHDLKVLGRKENGAQMSVKVAATGQLIAIQTEPSSGFVDTG
jgi:hypothetical protein